MKKIINNFKENPDKILYRLVLIAVILSMIPVWYLGRYAVPSLDDYYFGIMPRQAWLETHSLGAVIKAAGEMVKFYFYAKQATYSSVFLMSLFPGVINERWYFVTPIIMTGMLMGSLTVLIHTVFSKCMGIKNKYLVGIVNLLIIFLSIQTMVVPLEGIYWYNGALHYIFMNSVMYFEIALILNYLKSDNRTAKIWMLVVSALLGIVVGGGNLITGLQACILVALHIVLIVCQIIADKKDNKFLKRVGVAGFTKDGLLVLIPEVITVIAFLVNITAPGNAERQAFEEQMNPVKAVIESFYWGAVHGISWIKPMTIVVFAIIAVIIWKLCENNDRKYIHPLLMAFISYCIFAAMFTPTFYATSMDAPDRVKNIIGVAENVIILLNISNDFGYLRSKAVVCKKEKTEASLLTGIMKQTELKYGTAIFGGLVILAVIFLLPESKNTYTTLSAVRSIVIGDAARYYEESWERIDQYNDRTKDIVAVYPISDNAKPYLLFKQDISNDGEEGFWQNIEISDFYGKENIVVLERNN